MEIVYLIYRFGNGDCWGVNSIVLDGLVLFVDLGLNELGMNLNS